MVCLEDQLVSEYPLTTEFKTLEMAVYKIKHDSIMYDLLVVYRLPSASVIESCDEIASFIENNVVNLKGELIMIGDSNTRMDKLEDLDTITSTDFLSGLGLQNHMGFTTHQSQHTIDPVITRETLGHIAEVRKGFTVSDHAFINAALMVENSSKTKTEVSFRKIKSFTLEEFKCDLAELSKTFVSLDEPLDHLVHECNNTLIDNLSKHAPLKTKMIKITHTHTQPWFNDHIRCEIILRHKKEHDWNNDPTVCSWNAFYQQKYFVSNLMDSAKWNYYLDCIKGHHF